MGLNLLLTACTDVDSSALALAPQSEQLAILHINDHHSNLAPQASMALSFADEVISVEVGGMARVAQAITELRQQHEQVITLHAGDAITGDLYYTLFRGEADAAFMNHICFDAFSLGNHEFDDGDQGLAQFLDYLAAGDCNTPVLAANIKPALGTPLLPSPEQAYLQPYHVLELAGGPIAVIGLDIAVKTKNSSQPLETTEFLDEVVTAQHYIDLLKAQGIGRFILLTHYTYQGDLQLAQALTDVDVIIGGDSHTLLGDYADLQLPTEGPYPTQVRNAAGDLVCVAQAWQYNWVLGELLVEFAGDKVAACQGTPHLLVGDRVIQQGEDVSEQWLPALEKHPLLRITQPEPTAAEMLNFYTEQLRHLTEEVVASVPESLCRNLPHRTPSAGCGELARSDAHQLIAEAFLAQSREAEIAMQNQGGVRADILAGNFSIGHAYQVLPFSNTLVNLQATGAEIHQVMEEALDYALNGGGMGAYPHAAGLRFDVDLSADFGQRVSQIETRVKGTEQWLPLDYEQVYTIVTNSFIALGQDGWHTFAKLSADNRAVDTYINYAEALLRYAQTHRVFTRYTQDDYSTQKFIGLSSSVATAQQ